MMRQSKQGELFQADFFDLLKGLNTTDSPFKLTDEHTVKAQNWDYVVTGGISKRYGHTELNTTADTQLTTMGMFVHQTSVSTKTLIRAAGINLQTVSQITGATTPVSTDTSANTTAIFTTTLPVAFSQFNTTGVNVAWLAGGGQNNNQLGGFTGNQYTANGAVTPAAGSLTLTATGSSGTLPVGPYYYAIAFQKASTGAISNAALDVLVSVTTSQSVVITFSNVTNPDPTVYTKVVLFRSAVSDTPEFTAGNQIATVSWATGHYTDTGQIQGNAAVVPRPGNIYLDNSTLPVGTNNTVTTWKRRLVTASGSTLYFSDVNKPESWPLTNVITIPSGGDITALGVLNFTSPTTGIIDEMLCVFKERELWCVIGNYFTLLTDQNGNVTQNIDIALNFVDYVGCPTHNLLVLANGFLFWIDYRGVYIWDGNSKPIYISRPLEYDFNPGGDIDLSQLIYGVGVFARKSNQVVWILSSTSAGRQKLGLKLDLRLSLPNMGNGLAGRVFDGVFARDQYAYTVYGMTSIVNNAVNVVYGSGNDGLIWKMFDNPGSDGPTQPINFSYRTRPEDFGLTGTTKRYNKLIVWCQNSTTKNLTVNYWTDYNVYANNFQQRTAPIATNLAKSLWDVAVWDVDKWDLNNSGYTPLVFNLAGAEGTALTLEFQQSDLNTPLVIAGFTVIFTVVGLRI
jgi:hypothetical protein